MKTVATNVNQNAMAETGYFPGQVQAAPTIKSGIVQAIKLSKGIDATRKGLMELGNLFIAWMGDHHGEARTWDKVTASHLQGYVNAMEREELAYNTVSHRLGIVKTAWRLRHADHPGIVRPLPAVRRTAKGKAAVLDCLEPESTARLLDWLKVNRPDLWPMATPQALAGLRMFEAAALRRQDVDLKAGTVTIAKTPLHTPKNAASYRTMPVTEEVLVMLKAAFTGQKIRPAGGELFLNAKGEPWKKTGLDHRWSKARAAAAKDLYQAPETVELTGDQAQALADTKARFLAIPPHRLRASFATMASRLGCGDALIKCMLGHTGSDVLNQHYKVIGLDDLRGITEVLKRWREKEVWQYFGSLERLVAVGG